MTDINISGFFLGAVSNPAAAGLGWIVLIKSFVEFSRHGGPEWLVCRAENMFEEGVE
jgi:hypothetical protein